MIDAALKRAIRGIPAGHYVLMAAPPMPRIDVVHRVYRAGV
jgi:hypothetical protein